MDQPLPEEAPPQNLTREVLRWVQSLVRRGLLVFL